LAVIEAHELTRRFGKLTAVENLNLEVEAGEVLGFLGPNGAGRPPLSACWPALSRPHQVTRLSPESALAVREQLHEVIGLLTESPGFYNRLSAIVTWNTLPDFIRASTPGSR
jgi:ABC-2 type transport system ATP-binding protein